jgi:hypothetical protein
LIDLLEENDFGLFILAPDDVAAIRDKVVLTVRDNVIFELGLFIGRMGSERCFLVVPKGEELHLPTDLLGITPATFDPERQDGNLVAALGPACNRIRKSVKKLGSISASVERSPDAYSAQHDALVSDSNDCISLIQTWLGARSSSENRKAIRFDDVDRELKLARGSALQYIEVAAGAWNLVVDRKGKDFILFRIG